jgi:hypothetical protein
MAQARRLLWLLMASASSVAWACPVCGGAASSPESQRAYVVMSVILSALPLLGIAGIVLWVARRVRAAEASQGAERTPPLQK